MIIILFVLLVSLHSKSALTVSAVSSNNISCYRYAIADGIGSERIGDFSTYKGISEEKTKDNFNLLVNCQEWYRKTIAKSSEISTEDRVTLSCIKQTYDGRLKSSGKRVSVKLRSCIGMLDSNEQLEDNCYRYYDKGGNYPVRIEDKLKGKAIGDGDEGYDVIKDLEPDTKFHVCFCNSGGCNGSGRSGCESTNILFCIIFTTVGLNFFLN